MRLEEAAWKTATQGNSGDDLKLEVKIYSSDDKVHGPITRTWKVAPGVLKGTVYYNSYDSFLTTGGNGEMGGVIKIRPRSPDPELALPNMKGKCHVCHTVSADGSTLWAQDATGPKDTETEYANGASYNLQNGARTEYKAVPAGAGVDIANDHKFTWAAPYPDGSFALASAYYTREAYTRGDSKLFKRAGGGELASSGFTSAVKSAVTPAFAPDGRKVAFNFWEGPGAGPVKAGAGRSLAVMDFSCGATTGSVACAPNATNTFSNLREIYKDTSRWPAWPSFLPDNTAVVFHNTVHGGECAPASPNNPKDGSEYIPYKPSTRNCQLTTWYRATSELWVASAGATKSARRLDAANGNGLGLPTNGEHPDDTILNYQPTVNPVASGGYFWVVFTSRRIYGNLLTGKPWGDNEGDGGGPQKKLWVAAIDINNPNAGHRSEPPGLLPPRPGARGGQLARLLGRRSLQGERKQLRDRRRVLQRLLPQGRQERRARLHGQAAGRPVRAGVREVQRGRGLLRSQVRVHREQVHAS